MTGPRMPAWVPLVLVAMLVCGAALGVAADRALLHRSGRLGSGMMDGGPMRRGSMGPPSEERRRGMRERLARALELTPVQADRIDSIMARQFRALEPLYATMQPQLDSVFASTRAALDSVLTPAQREKRDRLFRERGGRGGRGRVPFGAPPVDGGMGRGAPPPPPPPSGAPR
ncbi:MAG: hypothetical protein MUE41_08545 [Gemmatimonadaceae bacterium]|jgi:Spy/CpxP family protein refolding chaperone|nr:hypothetical protein [Gemmatimonadaceae bacterium]